MRKQIISILTVGALAIAVTGCSNSKAKVKDNTEISEAEEAKTVKDTPTQAATVETTQQPIQSTAVETTQQPPLIRKTYYKEMPEPFSKGDIELRLFYGCTESKFDGGFPTAAFNEYLGNEEYRKDWENFDRLRYYNLTSLMDYPNLFNFIITYDIPNDVIVKNFENWIGVSKGDDYLFSEEEVAALLTRDANVVLNQFAADSSIIIGDNVYPPHWLYCHKPNEYEEVGITTQMVEERLDLYAEFYYTDEADVAFSEKLSEFIGREISLKQIREY